MKVVSYSGPWLQEIARCHVLACILLWGRSPLPSCYWATRKNLLGKVYSITIFRVIRPQSCSNSFYIFGVTAQCVPKSASDFVPPWCLRFASILFSYGNSIKWLHFHPFVPFFPLLPVISGPHLLGWLSTSPFILNCLFFTIFKEFAKTEEKLCFFCFPQMLIVSYFL